MGVRIPEKCGAILLPGAVLFPQGAMPLHIFEPRYREMLDDALEGDCMFCVGTLRGEETEDLSECTERIGTVGLIRVSKQIGDGRSHLILHGIARVEFGEWWGGKGYPFARISPMPSWPMGAVDGELAVETLRHALRGLLRGFPAELREQIEALLDEAENPGMLGDLVAHQFVQDVGVRRALLEEASVGRRLEMLTGYLRRVGSGEGEG